MTSPSDISERVDVIVFELNDTDTSTLINSLKKVACDRSVYSTLPLVDSYLRSHHYISPLRYPFYFYKGKLLTHTADLSIIREAICCYCIPRPRKKMTTLSSLSSSVLGDSVSNMIHEILERSSMSLVIEPTTSSEDVCDEQKEEHEEKTEEPSEDVVNEPIISEEPSPEVFIELNHVPSSIQTILQTVFPLASVSVTSFAYENELEILSSMGFDDRNRNREALYVSDGDIERAVEYLTTL